MPMKRVPPSAGFREEWNALVTQGVAGEQCLLGSLVKSAARYMLQLALEQEVAEFLGREHYERGEHQRRGYRNGYEQKKVVTAEGPIAVAVPQVRNSDEGYRSELVEALLAQAGSVRRPGDLPLPGRHLPQGPPGRTRDGRSSVRLRGHRGRAQSATAP